MEENISTESTLDINEMITEGVTTEVTEGVTEYYTPFACTVYYHEDSMAEYIMANMCSRAQLVPITSICDLAVMHDCCQYVTPEVIIFGTDFSAEDIGKFIARGFQIVHIFTYNPPARDVDRYANVNKCVVFDKDNVHEHLIVDSLAKLFIVDNVLCSIYPDYVSSIQDVSNMSGKCLIRAIETLGIESLPKMTSIHCFDELAKLVEQGKGVFAERERLANLVLSNGHFDEEHSAYLCNSHLFMGEMNHIAIVNPHFVKSGATFLVFYVIMSPQNVKLTAISSKKNCIQLLADLGADELAGHFGHASGRLSGAKFAEIFLAK